MPEISARPRPRKAATPDKAMSDSIKASEVEFLRKAARYFRKRPTGGEDRAHWANVYNAESCERIAGKLEKILGDFLSGQNATQPIDGNSV